MFLKDDVQHSGQTSVYKFSNNTIYIEVQYLM